MTIHGEYVRLIEETDKVLGRQRKLLLAAKPGDERLKYKNEIDETLDLRIEQMRRRDAARGAGL